MSADQKLLDDLLEHTLDHPCPTCTAPIGIECDAPELAAVLERGGPRHRAQHPKRAAAGARMLSEVMQARDRRRTRRRRQPTRTPCPPPTPCPSWCAQHLDVDDVAVHASAVRRVGTGTVGHLLSLVVTTRAEQGDTFGVLIRPDDTGVPRVVARPVELPWCGIGGQHMTAATAGDR